jgi:hypothetical protein
VTEERQRRLLIASRDLALLRGHYEDVIVGLAEAGVQVSVRYLHDNGLSAASYRESLLRRGCSVRVEPLPRAQPSENELLALRLRQLANLLRFYHRDYRRREWLRETKFARAAPGPRRWARRLGRLGSRAPLFVIRLVGRIDRVLPPSEPAQALVASERPDAVVAVPVIRTPAFVDLLKAAAWDGIPTASWVQSWDNLSSKGLLHFVPDRVFVWNSTQREELARYHGIPERNVCVTGAQTFDHWFNGNAPSERAAFCSRNGLDPGRPIILYLVSSRQIEPSPATFFDRWLAAIRSSGDPMLEGAFVFVRPHPTEVEPWIRVDRTYERVVVSPSTDDAPINSADFRDRYRDELHHATVVVALNTSAMIDAAIFGKPVCTVELPELAFGQRGTVHFEYLKTVSGGMLRTAPSLSEHVRTLAQLVRRDPYDADERSVRFVEAFVRPEGMDVKPATVFADEMLRILARPSQVSPPGPTARALGRLVHRAAPTLGAPLEQNPVQRRWRKSRKDLRRRWYRGRKRLRRKSARLARRRQLARRKLLGYRGRLRSRILRLGR